jgi:hypothetical protein
MIDHLVIPHTVGKQLLILLSGYKAWAIGVGIEYDFLPSKGKIEGQAVTTLTDWQDIVYPLNLEAPIAVELHIPEEGEGGSYEVYLVMDDPSKGRGSFDHLGEANLVITEKDEKLTRELCPSCFGNCCAKCHYTGASKYIDDWPPNLEEVHLSVGKCLSEIILGGGITG